MIGRVVSDVSDVGWTTFVCFVCFCNSPDFVGICISHRMDTSTWKTWKDMKLSRVGQTDGVKRGDR